MSQIQFFSRLNKISPFFAVIGLLMTAFTIYMQYGNPKKPNLTFEELVNSQILNESVNGIEFEIKYDTLNLTTSSDQISSVVLKIVNNGRLGIRDTDFDKSYPFGIQIENGEILGTAEIVSSNDQDYYRDIIETEIDNKIELKKKIFNKNDNVVIQFYARHKRGTDIEINPIGKLKGQNKIGFESSISPQEEIERMEKSIMVSNLTDILSIALITILSLLTLSLYKNNNLRAKANFLSEMKIERLSLELTDTKKELLKAQQKNKKTKSRD